MVRVAAALGLAACVAGPPALAAKPPPTTPCELGLVRVKAKLRQADANADGRGDACQIPDTDGDGRIDTLDNCPAVRNADQADQDGDNVGDLCDPDRDGDGRLTEKELAACAELYVRWLEVPLTLTTQGPRTGLFEMLDADGDGRLSLRELMTAEKRLLVHDRETKVAKRDVFRKQRMRTHQDVDLAGLERGKRRCASGATFAAGEDREAHVRRLRHRFQRSHMLARQDFGRRHQRTLRTGLDGREQRHHGDHCLSRPHVAL